MGDHLFLRKCNENVWRRGIKKINLPMHEKKCREEHMNLLQFDRLFYPHGGAVLSLLDATPPPQ